MREPTKRVLSVTPLAILIALLVWADLTVASLRLKVALLLLGIAAFSVMLVGSRVLSPNRPKQLHGTFSLRDRPWWTFGAVVLIAGIFALPAVLVAAIGQTGSSPLPESWWDVAWIVGALIVAAGVAWAVTRFSGAAIADVLGSKAGGRQRAATTTRHTGWPPLSQRASEVPSEPTVRAEAQPADGIAISSLALLLAARLEVALGPEFQVAPDESGHSIVVGYTESACRLDLPVGRFRLRPAADSVCLTCRLALAGVQQFASASLGYDWPQGALEVDQHSPLPSRSATPVVTEHEGLIILEWRTESGTVLALDPFALSEVFAAPGVAPGRPDH